MLLFLVFNLLLLSELSPVIAFVQSQVSEDTLTERQASQGGIQGSKQFPVDLLNRLRVSEFQTVEPTDEEATHTLAELRQGQLNWREALKSVHVDFIYSLDRRIETTEDQSNKRAGLLVPGDLSYAVSLAFKGDKLYETYRDLTPSLSIIKKKGKERKPRAGPVSFKWAFNGRDTRSHEEYRATGSIQHGRDIRIIQHGVWYFTAMFLPYGNRAAAFKATAEYPPEALARSGEYSILPRLDRVDGHLCHVVVSGHDIMWIDATYGFSIRRRAGVVRESNTIIFVHIAKDFVDASTSGIWAPKLWYCLRYCDEPAHFGKVQSVDKVVVSSVRVNDVPDSLFEISYPPGTKVVDRVNEVQYIVPSGEELLERAIAEGRPIINDQVVPAQVHRRASGLRRWLLLGNGVLASGILVILFFARRRRLNRSL